MKITADVSFPWPPAGQHMKKAIRNSSELVCGVEGRQTTAHGVNPAEGVKIVPRKSDAKNGIGSRRIFPPHFKLQVLDSYRNDADCKGNQRATARKYGIHRRQIQKWLQVEGNLRNCVGGKGGKKETEVRKCGIELALRGAGHRQRDDAAADAYSHYQDAARVPALSPVAYAESAPLDFTITRQESPPCDCDPLDLSLKRPAPPATPLLLHIPLTVPPYNAPPSDPNIWDLSTKPVKRKHESPISPKPVKLFKPYLDDLHDTSSSSSNDSHPQYRPPHEIKLDPAYTHEHDIKMEACFNAYSPYNNNNNNEIKSEYTFSYTELNPAPYYYNPITVDYPYTHEQDYYSSTPIKQRQTYSVDFKLSAIDSYYRDECCRGNQRAVASKYNIHRRQVQKWLKQEEELRQRNSVS